MNLHNVLKISRHTYILPRRNQIVEHNLRPIILFEIYGSYELPLA